MHEENSSFASNSEQEWVSGDELQQIITARSRHDAYERAADVLKRFFRAKGAALYVRDDENRNKIVRVPWEELPRPVADAVPLNSGHDSIVLTPTDVGAEKELCDISFAVEGWASSLFLRLRDHRGRFIGVAILADPDIEELHVSSVRFAWWIAMAARLARKCGQSLEQMQIVTAVSKLRQRIKKEHEFTDVLRVVLVEAIRLTGADRGDVCSYDWEKKELGFVSWIGGEFTPWRRYPPPGKPLGVIWDTWETGEGQCISNVLDLPYYCELDSRTQSELAIRIDRRDRPAEKTRRLAVFNLEAFHKDFFDKRDQELLQALVEPASEEFGLFWQKKALSELLIELSRVSDHTKIGEGEEIKKTAKAILKQIRFVYGFDAGIIYRADYYNLKEGKPKLRALEQIGYEDQWDVEQEPFAHDLLDGEADFDMSFAFHIFKKKEFDWVPDVQDPKEWGRGGRVSRRGVERFKIQGPMLGIRLSLGNEAIGALILWCTNRTPNPPPQPYHGKELQPFAALGSIILAQYLGSERRRTLQHELETILEGMQRASNRELHLQAIMHAVRQVGFDRVRVFEYIPGGRLAGLCSSGMGEMALEYEPKYIGSANEADKEYNEVVHWIIEHFKQSQTIRTTIFPTDDQRLPKDTHAMRFGKEKDTQWIEIPLVSAGKLYGSLAADNRKTKRAITEVDRRYLTILGSLAGRAFATAEKRGMLNAASLSALYCRALDGLDSSFLARGFVHFLRHENGGLGCSRALFLAWDDSRGCFRFVAAAGQLYQSEAEQAERDTRDLSFESRLDELFRRQDNLDIPGFDRRLWRAAEGYVLDPADPKLSPLLERGIDGMLRGRRHLGDTLPEASDFPEVRLLSILGETAQPVLVVISDPRDTCVVGLFIVDRAWKQPLSDLERASLRTFAQEAGQMLSLRELSRTNHERERLENIGFVTQNFRHELRRPINNLRMDIKDLSGMESRLTPKDALILRAVRTEIEQLVQLSDKVDWMADAALEPWGVVSIGELFAELRRQGEGEAALTSRCVEFAFLNQESITEVVGKRYTLLRALEQLVRNAVLAFPEPNSAPALTTESSPAKITIQISRSGTRVIFRVTDNGSGIPKRILSRLMEGETLTTRGLGRGMGWGLPIARRFATLLNGGQIKIYNNSGGGASVLLWYSPPIRKQE